MILRGYQQRCVDAALAEVKQSLAPCLIDAAPAAGKSFMIAAIAKALNKISGKRVLCLAPSAELVKQNHEKYLLTGERASIFSASAGAKSTRHVVVFGTPGTVKNAISRFTNDFCAVIVDECFTGDTLVSTPRGEVPIRTLRTGDIVCNAVGSGQVETIFTKAVSEIYHVKLTDGTIIKCTGSHPFFTEDGWTPARQLEGKGLFRKEDVSSLLDGFRTKVVQNEEQGRHPSRDNEPHNGSQLGQAGNLFSILRKEMDKPHAQRFLAPEDEGHPETYRTQTDSDLGEWTWPNSSTAGATGHPRRRLGGGASHSDKNGAQERHVPECVQGGPCVPREEDSDRGGWRQSRNLGTSGGGQEEGRISSWVRVESVSRVECESSETVYNLHVSGHPSYLAGGVLVHNCHGLTPTIRDIIDAMRQANPNLRVIGLSGTPYQLGTGFIFRLWPDDRANGDDTCRDPYFTRMVYRVSAREMLDDHFITPMTVGQINSSEYDTSGVVLLPNGTLQTDTVERAFVGHGRKTAAIVADVLSQAQNRPGGVMYFAATIRHAQEIMASLPPANSALVTGDTSAKDRKAIIAAYRAQKVRHLVNVGTLTTGFDVSHTGTIALLRYTESAALLQQIMGRAWRLHDGKDDSLLLDYAGNVERHFPDGDIYNPAIKAGPIGGGGEPIEAECPDCSHHNSFRLHPDYVDYQRDRHGYALDVFGERIMSEYGPVSTHYGRRCFGELRGAGGAYVRCGYRWTGKDCPQCGEKNDISARHCYACKAEIVNPNDKLVAEFKALKRDPTQPQTDVVLSMEAKEGVSRAGNRTIRVDWSTPHRNFSTWFQPDGKHGRAVKEWNQYQAATEHDTPETISYVKDTESGFFRVLAYNLAADEAPTPSPTIPAKKDTAHEVSGMAPSLWRPDVSRVMSA